MAERPYLTPIGTADITPNFSGLRDIVRRFKVSGRAATAATVESDCFRAFGVADDEFTLALLVAKHLDTASSDKNATDKILTETYREFTAGQKVNVGEDRIEIDEDGRKALFQRFVCKASDAESLAGTPGSAGPTGYTHDGATINKNGVGAVITVRYGQTNATPSTPDALGPVVVSYPFNDVGDPTHAIASQRYEQPAANYAPLSLNSSRVVMVGGSNTTLYFIGDVTPPARNGASLVQFTSRWANTPATRFEYQEIAYAFPGIGANQAEFSGNFSYFRRKGFTEKVNCQIELAFYRVGSGTAYASEADIPRVARTKWAKADVPSNSISAHEIFLSDVNYLRIGAVVVGNPLQTFAGNSVYVNLLTVPTRAQYQTLVAANAFNLVVDCEVDRYQGNIFVRRTWRVKAI